MVDGISNFQNEEVFRNINDDDINDNFVGAFPSNHMKKFIDHASMIFQKKGKYPFVVVNTDNSSKNETHWWSVLDTEPKTDIFFFDSFGVNGLKSFIIQDDKKFIEKILFGTNQMKKADDKVTLVNIRFNLNACKNLSKKELDALSHSATIFFHFIQAFSKKLKLKDFVNIWMVEDRVQDLDCVTCGIFQIYFYDNLFNADQNSKMQNKKPLDKKTVEILLSKLFVLDDQKTNEEINEQHANKHNITIQ